MDSLTDIWVKAEELTIQNQNHSLPAEPEDKSIINVNSESTVLFLGESSSGKSSLIQMFLKPNVTKEPKSTVALEYNYARKKVLLNNFTTSCLANIWELGGDISEMKLLEIPINKSTLFSTTIFICVDLSKPNNILSSLQKWIRASRELVRKIISDNKTMLNPLSPSPATSHNKLLYHNATIASYQDNRKDASRVRPSEIPIYLILNKYDIFKTFSTFEKRSILQSIRMMAHYHGLYILTTSINDSIVIKDLFKQIMTQACFPPAFSSSTKINPGNNIEYNSDKPIYIIPGKDDFENILSLSFNKVTGTTKVSLDSDQTTQKSRLLISESDYVLFLTSNGVTKDCWTKYGEHVSLLNCFLSFIFI
jgi:dynein light intermediate chain 2